MDKEQIKAIARSIWNIRREDEDRCDMEIEDLRESHSVFKEAEAAIESYKAELLNEVGEPVAYMCSDEELCRKGYERFSRHNSGDWSISVFTSDQVAAAIIKATKPLEDEVKAANSECELFRKNGRIVDANKIVELRAQLASAQGEIKRLRIALDCTKMDLVRMRCPDFFEGVKDGYETLFDGHLVNMIGLINDYAKQK